MKRFELKDEKISFRDALRAAEAYLKTAGVDDPETDAMLLLEKASGYSRNAFFMHRDERIPATVKAPFCEMIRVRAERIPLQHITGEAFFYGRRFIVNADVLIPRMDTEVLVYEALKSMHKGMDVLDLCTGSGCIAVTIAKEADVRVTASDKSKRALDTARMNAKLNEADCVFVQSDMFEDIKGSFDAIISNPPYIKKEDIKNLQEEVGKHDPIAALDGGADGLDFYRVIAQESAAYLKSGGRLFLETGSEQTEAVSELLRKNGFLEIAVAEDLNHLPRVVKAVSPK